MNRAGVLTVAALLAVAEGPAARQVPFKSETRLVVVHVSVQNAKGDLVTDLPRDAFTILEDGKPQQLSIFSSDDVPVSLGLVIDNSASIAPMRPEIEAAALAYVRASNKEDEAFVVDFTDTPRLDVPFTNDLDVLQAGLKRRDAIGGTAMRDAVNLAVTYANDHAKHDRRALLIFTDGRDNASAVSRRQLLRAIGRQDIAIYAIGLLSAEDPGAARHAREDLDALVEATGGTAYYPDAMAKIEPLVLEIAHQLRSQYTLGYSPTNTRLDGSYRKIRVDVKANQKLTVRTRPGYHADANPVRP
jgi:Ca-activated chloride channel homolog